MNTVFLTILVGFCAGAAYDVVKAMGDQYRPLSERDPATDPPERVLAVVWYQFVQVVMGIGAAVYGVRDLVLAVLQPAGRLRRSASRRGRLPAAVKVSLLLVPDRKRTPLSDDLLNDRLDGAKWSRLNGVRSSLKIGVSSRWAELLELLNIPRHEHWWQEAGDRGMAIRFAAASVLGFILTNVAGVGGGGLKPLGVVPSFIWYCSILRTELAAARRIAGDEGDDLEVD